MFKSEFINKYYIVTNSQTRIQLSLLLILLIFSSFLEMIGIGMIPIFVLSIQDPDKIIYYLEYFKISLSFFNNNNIIYYLAIFGITMFILKNLILSFILYYEYKVLVNISKQLNRKLYYNYINLNYVDFAKLNPSKIQTNLLGETRRTLSLIVSIIKFLREFFVALLIILVTVFYSSVTIFSIIILLILGSYFFYKFFKNKLAYTSLMFNNYVEMSMKNINEFVNSFREIKNYKRENLFVDLYENQIFKRDDAQFAQNFIMQLPRVYLEILFILLMFIVMIVFNNYYSDKTDFFVNISFLFAALLRFYPAFNIMLSAVAKIKSNILALNIVGEQLINFKNSKLTKINKYFFKNFDNINIQDIFFHYSNKKNILNNINLKIKKGDKIGIIGSSGSGKSSLLDIIAGFQKPTKGKIIINNENGDKLNYDWYNLFSYVSQQTFLFDDTIKNNITFKEQENKVEKIKLDNAIMLSCLNEFINELDLGIDTIIGHNAVNVSGGQKQRIAIARSLYSSKPILILDEATNALDAKTEKKLINNLVKNQENLTIIFVSHRLETLSSCDKVYKLDNNNLFKVK